MPDRGLVLNPEFLALARRHSVGIERHWRPQSLHRADQFLGIAGGPAQALQLHQIESIDRNSDIRWTSSHDCPRHRFFPAVGKVVLKAVPAAARELCYCAPTPRLDGRVEQEDEFDRTPALRVWTFKDAEVAR